MSPDLARVTHFQAEDKLSFTMSEGRVAWTTRSGELEKTLDPRKWVRIHRSSVVKVH